MLWVKFLARGQLTARTETNAIARFAFVAAPETVLINRIQPCCVCGHPVLASTACARQDILVINKPADWICSACPLHTVGMQEAVVRLSMQSLV
eukprot:355037-Amphidinium_carterae.1